MGVIGIMEKKIETTIVYCGYMGLYRDDGQGNGNCYNIFSGYMGLCRDNGKQNGNYYVLRA